MYDQNFKGGGGAHRWRKSLGAVADGRKRGDYVQTFKFPAELENGGLPDETVEAANNLFGIVEGFGEGSLKGLFCALHLSGVDIYSKAELAKKAERTRGAFLPKSRTITNNPKKPFYHLDTVPEEYRLHLCIAVIAAMAEGGDYTIEEKSSKLQTIKTRLIDTSGNGLSWFFNAGLKWLQETAPDEIASQLKLPDDQLHRAEQLRRYAKSIPQRDPLWGNAYAWFRTHIQGAIHSWTSNYWNRLVKMREFGQKDFQISIPPEIRDKQADYPDFFSGNDQLKSAADIEATGNDIIGRIRRGAEDIHLLMGLKGCPDAGDLVDRIRRFSELSEQIAAFSGEIETLNNRINQWNEDNDDKRKIQPIRFFYEQEERAQRRKEVKLNKLERLNRWAFQKPSAEEYAAKIGSDFDRLVKHRREHYARLKPFLARSSLESSLAEQQERLASRPGDYDMETLAKRSIFDRFCRMARKLQTEKRETDIVAAPLRKRALAALPPTTGKTGRKNRNGNKYFSNRQGGFYMSPFARRRHEPYEVTPDGLNEDWVQIAEHHLQLLLRQDVGADDLNVTRAVLDLENFCVSMRLKGLPDSIDAGLTQGFLDAHNEGLILIKPLWHTQVNSQVNTRDGKIARPLFLKLFNQYQSALNGLCAQMGRASLISRLTFSRDSTSKLVYAPKNKSWRPPAKYAQTDTPISRALRSAWIVWEDGEQTTIDAEATFACLWNNNASITDEIAAYLRQAPHDWFLPSGFKEISRSAIGMTFAVNNGNATNKGKEHSHIVKLKGPSSFLNRIDRVIRAPQSKESIKLGDPALIIDTAYGQRLARDGDAWRVELRKQKTTLDVAIPFIDKDDPENAEYAIWNNMVAIDQGERGIGYAVFDLLKWLESGDLTPIAQGAMPVPSIRKLIRAARRHRRVNQPKQKISQRYSNHLEKRRQNTIGDTCRAIEILMQEHKAFPVLESTVSHFEEGGNQLKLVYKSASSMFLFSDIDARNKQRAHHWHQGDRWPHPWLIARGNKETPLNLFPGASVSPVYTSQICHRCGHNIAARIQSLGKQSLSIAADNSVVLPRSGRHAEITVMLSPPDDWPKRGHFPFPSPRPGRITAEKLRALARKFIRHPQPDPRSKDTKQSRFQCLNAACRWSGHADANAAINIGVKFLREKTDREKSVAAKKAFDRGGDRAL